MRRKLQMLCLILGFSALWMALARADVTLGQSAPALTLTDLNGASFDLAAAKGKVVVVHFWATWCAPCQTEMPALDHFYKQYHQRGVEIAAISTDAARHRDDVVKFMQAYTFPASMLNDVTNNGFGRPTGIPVTYIVNPQGIIAAKLTPDNKPLTDAVLTQAVMPLLSN